MIITENLTINGKDFIKTYSDENRYVVRDGISYGEAIDPASIGRVYIEGDVMEDYENYSETEMKAVAYDIIVGGE